MGSLLISVVEMGLELIILWDTSEFLDSCLDRRNSIHMLQVSSYSLQLQGSPDKDLVNALSVITPFAEHMAGCLVCLGSFLGRLATLPEEYLDLVRQSACESQKLWTYGSICSLVVLENGAQLFPEGGIDRLEDRLNLLEDNAPELFVLLSESERNANRLRVVRRGGEGKDIGDQRLDTFVRDLGGSCQTMDTATVSRSFEPLVSRDGRHFGRMCREWMFSSDLGCAS